MGGLGIRALRRMERSSRLWTIRNLETMAGPWQWSIWPGRRQRCPLAGTAFRDWLGRRTAVEIWFSATRTGGDRSLYATDLAGKVRLLARVPGELTILDVGKEGNVLLTRGNDRAGIIGLAPGETKEKDLSWLDWSVPGSLSSDGKKILFQEAGEGGGPKYAVYLRNTDGAPAIRLGEGSGLSLSPDGKWALSRLNVTPSPLVLYPTGVGEMRRLKDDGLNHIAAAFLPDGKSFVFTGTESGHGVRLYRESLDDAKAQPFSVEGVRTEFFVARRPIGSDDRSGPESSAHSGWRGRAEGDSWAAGRRGAN